jgi:hypothetical protein
MVKVRASAKLPTVQADFWSLEFDLQQVVSILGLEVVTATTASCTTAPEGLLLQLA